MRDKHNEVFLFELSLLKLKSLSYFEILGRSSAKEFRVCTFVKSLLTTVLFSIIMTVVRTVYFFHWFFRNKSAMGISTQRYQRYIARASWSQYDIAATETNSFCFIAYLFERWKVKLIIGPQIFIDRNEVFIRKNQLSLALKNKGIKSLHIFVIKMA